MNHQLSFSNPSSEEKMGLLDERRGSDSSTDTSESSTSTATGGHFHLGILSPSADTLKAPFGYIRSTPWRILAVRFLVFLTPSFLQGRHAREQICPAKLAPTAYLDGMRGLAALFVFFCHYSYQAFTIAKGWGYEDNYHFLKLPFFRLWYQGPPAVCVFFVISGYALSYRPLKLIRSGAWPDFANTMSSLMFRRGIRLYLPTAISTFMIICLLRIGAYEWTRGFANDRKYMKNIVEPHPDRMEHAYAQYKDWLLHMFRFIQVFSWDKFGGSTSYDVHLWTIPVEFRCSLYLFLTIIGTARLRTSIRWLTVGFVMWVTYRNSRWELLLFFCGMLIAENDHIRGAHIPASNPALPVEEKPRSAKTKLWPIFWALFSLLGLYLMCQPDDGGEHTPGWMLLSSLIPNWWKEERYRYWQSAGAIIFIIAVSHSPRWQRFFNLPVVQYFGKISYALYLMHGPAMHVVGYHFEKWAYGVTGVEGYWYNAGFFLGACFCIPIVVWWADIFWRAVDIPTVKFAKWYESKVIVKA
ncbi:acyltransferase family domain-containing protein [Trichoderma chlorosporum]